MTMIILGIFGLKKAMKSESGFKRVKSEPIKNEVNIDISALVRNKKSEFKDTSKTLSLLVNQ